MLEELERVRAYRADLPEPDDATVDAARTALMAAIRQEPRPASAAQPRERRRRLQRRRRLVLAGGLAAVGLVLAGVFGFDTASAPQSALAAQMNQLAKVAASQAWTGIPGPGQYLYTESQGLTSANDMANNQECSVAQVEHRQIWIATDGSGALNDTRDQSRFTSSADRAACAGMGITDPNSQNSSWQAQFGSGGLSFPTNDWKSLSTDPATLLTQVRERDGGPNTPAEWFTNVADFMRESDVPAGIRAALYQATALIPGVKLLGPQTDPTGQAGLGVADYSGGEPTHELIFDQQTGRLLAEEYFDKTGKMTDWTAYTAQKIVETLPHYPMQASGQPSSSGSGATQGQTTPTTAAGTATASAPSQAPGTTTTGN